jgi:hypothetical protein
VAVGYQRRCRVAIQDQDGWTDEVALIDHTTTALPRRKANYLAYVGRKVGVKAGAYRLTFEITNGEKQIVSKIRSFTVSK